MKRNIFDGKSAASTSEKKKKYQQKFRDSWLEDPLFKFWIKKLEIKTVILSLCTCPVTLKYLAPKLLS